MEDKAPKKQKMIHVKSDEKLKTVAIPSHPVSQYESYTQSIHFQ
jgi:hypothetical protein